MALKKKKSKEKDVKKVKKTKKIKTKETTSQDNWEGRSLHMRCKTCMCYTKKKDLDDVRISIGRCRKRAPTMDGFPVVFATDWCMAHKLDENKI